MFLLVTMSHNRVLGREGQVPWNVPEASNQTLALVDGQTVILDCDSWQLLGTGLKNSHNIVLGRSAQELPGAMPAEDLDKALMMAWKHGKKIFCVGGASLFEQTLPLATKLYVNYIEGEYEGDTYFPAFDEEQWEVERRRQHERFEFVVYRRKK